MTRKNGNGTFTIRKRRHDPLVAAVIAKLPEVGQPFAKQQREAWLKMMVNAMDVAYGPAGPVSVGADAPIHVTVQGAPAAPTGPASPRVPHAGHDYYVDPEGYARMDDGSGHGPRINVADVPGDEVVYDYRRGSARDRDTIIWADETRGCNGVALSIGGPG